MGRKKQPWPSVAAVAEELRGVNANVEGECDVRLQVHDGEPLSWRIRYGDASYDQDHRGSWGAGSVPGVVRGRTSRFDSVALAKDLLEQAKDMHAQGDY